MKRFESPQTEHVIAMNKTKEAPLPFGQVRLQLMFGISSPQEVRRNIQFDLEIVKKVASRDALEHARFSRQRQVKIVKQRGGCAAQTP
jgi:hypothetical protein